VSRGVEVVNSECLQNVLEITSDTGNRQKDAQLNAMLSNGHKYLDQFNLLQVIGRGSYAKVIQVENVLKIYT
jgi:hypothetical protein